MQQKDTTNVEQSQLYTTFITPSEHYNRHMAEAFEGLTGFRRVVDDVIIHDKDISNHVSHVKKFLQKCQERRMSINQDKWVFCQTKVKFAGFQLSSDGYRIDPSITEALTQFPTPANRSDLQSFFGLVNQLSSSTDTVAQLLLPLRPLLNTKK